MAALCIFKNKYEFFFLISHIVNIWTGFGKLLQMNLQLKTKLTFLFPLSRNLSSEPSSVKQQVESVICIYIFIHALIYQNTASETTVDLSIFSQLQQNLFTCYSKMLFMF